MIRGLVTALAVSLALGCSRRPAPVAATVVPAPASILSPAAEIGKLMFVDVRLSASGKQSCASCHDPAYAYAPSNDLAVQVSGPNLDQPGFRAVPSLRYKDYTLAYSDTYENPDRVSKPGPGGGFTWDGRAASLAEQASMPLMSPFELANENADTVVRKVATGTYAERFAAVFGARVFDDPKAVYAHALEALQAFQIEDPSFHPYSSKFDLYSNNKIGGTLSTTEQRGLRLYVDTTKGNCIACHLLGTGNGGSQNITSDYSFAAIGVPRNRAIPANADPKYFDLGLCGPERRDHVPIDGSDPKHYCGLFKTPLLRNVATRKTFMHNGRFHTLRETLEFYATRDTSPEKWYPVDARGKVDKFDDLPPAYRASLDTQLPLDGRRSGSARVLSDQDIDDLLAFLETLSDGYSPPATPPTLTRKSAD